jgi:hypothetical protein
MRLSLSSLIDKSAGKGADLKPKASSTSNLSLPQTPSSRSKPDLSSIANQFSSSQADSTPLPPPPMTEKEKEKLTKIGVGSLPFGLGESPAYGKQSSASSTSKAMSGGAKSAGKLLKAAKTVQNMVKVTNAIATPRVPSLSTAAEREDFEELIKRNDEYFARLLSSQVQTSPFFRTPKLKLNLHALYPSIPLCYHHVDS